MNILIRLPNWLGDLVMSSAFVRACAAQYPGSSIDVIVKKDHGRLLSLFGGINSVYSFERKDVGSIIRLMQFSRSIANQKPYDLFFCLPGSFSSALGGYLTRSRLRVGYKGDLRSPLLTHSYRKPSSVHRVQEYLHLLNAYTGNRGPSDSGVHLDTLPLSHIHTVLSGAALPRPWILFNPNSEAQSRRVPLTKAAAIAKLLLKEFGGTLVLPGARSDCAFTQSIRSALPDPEQCINAAGTTDCLELAALCHSVDLVVTTDSGIAHLAAAAGRPVSVLFGAGNPADTAPYADSNVHILKADGIPCASCVSNTCAHQEPPCIMRIDDDELMRVCGTLLKSA